MLRSSIWRPCLESGSLRQLSKNTSLRIAYVLMLFPAPSETFARRDIDALRSLGHEVVPLSLYRAQGASRLRYWVECLRGLSCSPGLVAAFRLLVRLLFSPGWRPLERLKCIALLPAAARVAGELSRLRPDVIHLFWGHYPALVTLLVRPLLPHSRFSLFLGAYDLELKLPVSRWAAELSEVCFTHAHVNIPHMMALLGNRSVHVVHRGIDLSDYPAADALRFSCRPLRIFTAGRLIPEKGFDKVIDQFVEVVNQYPDAELVIAGVGPDLERLCALVQSAGLSERVTFPGWLSEVEVRNQLLDSRVFVLLSSKPGERLPNVVKEAMAAGCIAIASHSPGIDELIQHGVDGFICDVDDGEAIQAAIGYGFASDEAISLSRAAATKIRDAFDVEHAARRYADCWSQID